MSISVKKLVGEPIIHAQFTGHVDDQDLLQMFQRSQELARDIQGRVYRITEMSNVEMSHEEMMRILKAMASRSVAGGTSDPRFRAVLVGTQLEAHSLSENAQQSGMDVPLFDSYEKALGYLRWQIHAEN